MVALRREFQLSRHPDTEDPETTYQDGELSIYARSRQEALRSGLLIGCNKDALGEIANDTFPGFHTALSAGAFTLLMETAHYTHAKGMKLTDHFAGLLAGLREAIASKQQKGANIYFRATIGDQAHDFRADLLVDPEYGRSLNILLHDER